MKKGGESKKQIKVKEKEERKQGKKRTKKKDHGEKQRENE